MSHRYRLDARAWSSALPARDLEMRIWGIDEWKLGSGIPLHPADDSITFSGLIAREDDVVEAALAAKFAADVRAILGPRTRVEITLKRLDMTETPLDMGPGNVYRFQRG